MKSSTNPVLRTSINAYFTSSLCVPCLRFTAIIAFNVLCLIILRQCSHTDLWTSYFQPFKLCHSHHVTPAVRMFAQSIFLNVSGHDDFL